MDYSFSFYISFILIIELGVDVGIGDVVEEEHNTAASVGQVVEAGFWVEGFAIGPGGDVAEGSSGESSVVEALSPIVEVVFDGAVGENVSN
jgi:hypothetical protein